MGEPFGRPGSTLRLGLPMLVSAPLICTGLGMGHSLHLLADSNGKTNNRTHILQQAQLHSYRARRLSMANVSGADRASKWEAALALFNLHQLKAAWGASCNLETGHVSRS